MSATAARKWVWRLAREVDMPGDAASARIKPEGVRLDPALRAAGEKRIVLLWNLGRSSRPQTVPDRTSPREGNCLAIFAL